MATKSIGFSQVFIVLNDFRTAVDTVMKDEIEGASVNFHIEAARDVGLAIENANFAYTDVLSTIVDKVNLKVREQLYELKSIVEVLQARQSTTVLDLPGRVQRFIKSLPIADWQPQLTGLSPRYVIVEKGRFKISFLGLFMHVGAGKGGCILTIANATQIKRINATPDRLSFDVTLQEQSFSPTALENRHFLKGVLEIDHNVGTLRDNYRRVKYEVCIGFCPLGIGKITYTHSVTEVFYTNRNVGAITVTLARNKETIKARIEHDVRIKSSPGWKFDGSVPPQVHSRGDILTLPEERYDSDHIDVTVKLNADEEVAESKVTFQETKQETEVKDKTEQVPRLKWGEIYDLYCPQLRFFEFTDFEEKKHKYTGATDTNPYLKIRKVKDGFQLVATAPLLS